GEEMEYLESRGVRVGVVPGITAASGIAATLGVPLTHRDHAHGVLFITGHAKPGGRMPDWAALAATAHAEQLTLVIYMGVSGAQQIEQGLLRGLPAASPVALVQHSSVPTQRQALTTLDQLHATLVREELGSPCIIVVGEVLQALQPLQLADPLLAWGT
ncbi:MAG: SAM-dependent methyltransferase, partial [Curvibacter sp.]